MKKFHYEGKTFDYLDHPYNDTAVNERRIEIPIALEYLKRFKGKKILEVGNVMSYYYPPGIIDVTWDILDKYEIVPEYKVINEDILTFKPKEPYDMVFSVSTMEHIGYDPKHEYPGEHGDLRKGVEAIKNIQQHCLKKGGEMMMTIPWAYNAAIYLALFDKELGFQKASFMKRMTTDNLWQQVPTWEYFSDVRYNYPYYAGNGVIIAYYHG